MSADTAPGLSASWIRVGTALPFQREFQQMPCKDHNHLCSVGLFRLLNNDDTDDDTKNS